MKYKIHKVTVGHQHYFEVIFKKHWFSRWQQVKVFYKSPFEEMHGWWSGCFPTLEEANQALQDHALGNNSMHAHLVHDKEV